MSIRKRRKRKVNTRAIVLFGLLVFVMLIFSIRLVDFQLITASDYASVSSNSKTIDKTIKAARGEILDRYGRPIVVNRDGYDVVFNYADIDMSTVNNTILELTDLLAQSGQEWVDVLPITDSAPYKFDGTDTEISILKSRLELNTYATVENCYDAMVEKYNLEGMDEETQRLLMGVRYSMDKSDFSIYTSYTFAEDISKQLLTYIEESYSHLSGVSIETTPYREYVDSTLAPHLIGVMSKITAEEWEEYSAKGYSYNDTIGAYGVEKVFEDYLHGEDGVLSYIVDNSGTIISSEVTKKPENGNTIYLSVDKNLQKTAQNTLQSVIEEARTENPEITGGSTVVVEVKTGQILAAANYPSYDLNSYYEKYEELSQDTTGIPLNNRAFSGVYPPGSCFKPLVACIGLETGTITRDEYITCNWRYTYYSADGPTCMHRHGSIGLITALSKSCNVYFFDVGRRVGIDAINDYAKLFGLGVKTGDSNEIYESAGRLAGPEFSEKIGSTWYEGNTLSAAIGQGDNAFTPLQLAIYTATIANGGTRYESTVLNSIKTYDLSETVQTADATVAAQTGVSENTINIVKEGMLSVTEDGTASAYFSDYPIRVAGKTGTSENSGKDHSVFVCFAPYDDPEIAISVVVEHGQYSTTTGPVAKAILDEYFFGSQNEKHSSSVNTLLQ